MVGAYGLGKSQRVIALLREAGYERPIYLHGALAECCALYEIVRRAPRAAEVGDRRQARRDARRDRAGSRLRRLPTAGRAGCPIR